MTTPPMGAHNPSPALEAGMTEGRGILAEPSLKPTGNAEPPIGGAGELVERLRDARERAYVPAAVRGLLTEAGNRVLRLEAALKLALEWLGRQEPGDSRAVSSEFVAMLTVLCGNDDTASRQIIYGALLDLLPSCYCGGLGAGVHATGCPEAAELPMREPPMPISHSDGSARLPPSRKDGKPSREEVAKIIWETWVRAKDLDTPWIDAYLYAPEDARCVEACAEAVLSLFSPEDGWRPLDPGGRFRAEIAGWIDDAVDDVAHADVATLERLRVAIAMHDEALPPPPGCGGGEGTQGLSSSSIENTGSAFGATASPCQSEGARCSGCGVDEGYLHKAGCPVLASRKGAS